MLSTAPDTAQIPTHPGLTLIPGQSRKVEAQTLLINCLESRQKRLDILHTTNV